MSVHHNLADIKHNIDGLVQDCSNSIANALELLQSCTGPSIWLFQDTETFKYVWEMNAR